MHHNPSFTNAQHTWKLLVVFLIAMSYGLTPTVSTASSNQQQQNPQLVVQVPMLNIDHSSIHERIIGGTQTTANEFPWMAYVYIDLDDTGGPGGDVYTKCGGSLVARQYIITSAQCIIDYGKTVPVAASDITVYMGAHKIVLPWEPIMTSRVQKRTGVQLFIHDNYNHKTKDYDIAVIKLNAPVTINPYVKTILLAKSNETHLFKTGNDVTVTGWGDTSSGSTDYLHKTTIDIIARTTCNSSNSYAGSITGRMLCATRARKGACFGDKGGPLFLRDARLYKQVGIHSWGRCANTKYPGVYSHVGVLRNWVASKVPALP